jgi:hypothetical protein
VNGCLVGWGLAKDAMRPFCCVIESLATKYTMWDSNGTPLRATCTVRLKEADIKDHPAREYGEKLRGADLTGLRSTAGDLRDFRRALRERWDAQDKPVVEQYAEMVARRLNSFVRRGR